jgi:hypothetical protein
MTHTNMIVYKINLLCFRRKKANKSGLDADVVLLTVVETTAEDIIILHESTFRLYHN